MKSMADLRRRTGFDTAIWTTKLVVVAAGIVSVFLLAKFALPHSVGILTSSLPRLWTFIRGWLVPPYLFITVHLIIITIWKLSENKLHKDHPPEEDKSPDAPLPLKPKDLGPSPPIALLRKPSPEIWHDISSSLMVSGENPWENDATTPFPVSKSAESSPSPTSEASCLTTESDEKSTGSSVLDDKKSVKPAKLGEGSSALGDENESLDARWKVILEGGAAPAVPQLKKSDTWERSHRVERETEPTPALRPELRTSATFKEPARSAAGRGSEPLAGGHDEWNRRFEDFIKKNYDQIRLQKPHGRRTETVYRASD